MAEDPEVRQTGDRTFGKVAKHPGVCQAGNRSAARYSSRPSTGRPSSSTPGLLLLRWVVAMGPAHGWLAVEIAVDAGHASQEGALQEPAFRSSQTSGPAAHDAMGSHKR